jgi:TatD DNase family protein
MSQSNPQSSPLVDTHAHLDDRRLRADLGGVLSRATAAGVTQVIAIGTTAETSAGVIELAQTHPGVFAAVGIHPNDAAEASHQDWEAVVAWAGNAGVVAIGETGLDRYWKRTPFEDQQAWFDRHLRLAQEHDLPIVIHCRDCQDDIIEQLRRLGRPVQGVMHSFTGTWEHARACLELGLHLSFAGMVTFANKALDPLREVAARMPIDRLLVETDSPYLSPHPLRGKPNEPCRVSLTAACLAELRGIPAAEFALASTANARRLFRLPADVTL